MRTRTRERVFAALVALPVVGRVVFALRAVVRRVVWAVAQLFRHPPPTSHTSEGDTLYVHWDGIYQAIFRDDAAGEGDELAATALDTAEIRAAIRAYPFDDRETLQSVRRVTGGAFPGADHEPMFIDRDDPSLGDSESRYFDHHPDRLVDVVDWFLTAVEEDFGQGRSASALWHIARYYPEAIPEAAIERAGGVLLTDPQFTDDDRFERFAEGIERLNDLRDSDDDAAARERKRQLREEFGRETVRNASIEYKGVETSLQHREYGSDSRWRIAGMLVALWEAGRPVDADVVFDALAQPRRYTSDAAYNMLRISRPLLEEGDRERACAVVAAHEDLRSRQADTVGSAHWDLIEELNRELGCEEASDTTVN